MRRNSLALYMLAALAVVALLAVIAFLVLNPQEDTPEALAGTAIDPPRELTDFTLIADNGEPLSLSDLRGQYVLTYFGFTHCPDVCPATLLKYRQIANALNTDDVTFLFISVDGERDTPELLARYLERYDEDFIGMSGTDEVLQTILTDYGLFYERRDLGDGRYLVDHTASSFLINPEGELIRIYSFTTEAEAIVADLQALL